MISSMEGAPIQWRFLRSLVDRVPSTRFAVRFPLVLVLTLISSTGIASAHVGGLSGTAEAGPVPTWLTIGTGGAIVGASFLFTSLMTDHGAIRAINDWRMGLAIPNTLHYAAGWAVRGLSIGLLVVILVTGFLGPPSPQANLAILVVWAGWWAGYTMLVYLIGNTWPLVNPWRAMAELLPLRSLRSYPSRLGSWPSVIALLGLVWIEVVSPVAQDPVFLAALIVGYSAITLSGAVVFGTEAWFGQVDPVARVFRFYGRLAPFQRTTNGIEFKLPGAAVGGQPVVEGRDDVAFIVALLWVTTYDGFVSTPFWSDLISPVVRVGIPALLLYIVAILAGFGLFLWVYRRAARYARQTADTYVSASYIEGWFASSLLPIAAGYHIAHFLGYFLSLAPLLLAVIGRPMSGPMNPQLLVVPSWFPILQLLFVLLGHLVAIWLAHALAFELFPGKFKPIRSQYPFIVVMIFYTMTSMWVVTQPFVQPPYL